MNEINDLHLGILEDISNAETIDELEKIRITSLGKKGSITKNFKEIGKFDLLKKREYAERLNLIKKEIINLIDKKKIHLKNIDIKKAKWNGDIKIDDHYELTTDHNDLKGYDVLLVTRTRPTPTMESKAISTEKVNSFNFKTNKRLKTFNLYILKNWK